MNGKYILGGGISGLIYAYYNKDFTIISPDIGGKLNHKFFENTILFHATPETEEFLKSTGVKYEKKTHVIKYLKENKVLSQIGNEDKVLFIQKKMDDFEFIPKDVNLSTSDYFISVFELDFTSLFKVLTKDLKYINSKVIRITDDEIITEQTSYKYSKVVSTFNSKFFWNTYHKSKNLELKSKPITFVLCDKIPDSLNESTFDLCYTLDKESKITRITKKTRNQTNSFLYEFTGRLTKNECEKYLPKDSKILEYYVDNDGIIFTNKNNIPPENFLFVGRFATWNHSDKQQDVIKASKVDFELQNVWNIQKFFTSNFVNFNELKDTKLRESLTKDYFVALMPELTEVINEINYKQHKKTKVVNRDLLLEEFVDVFKYFLNMLLMWDITPEEFIKAFKLKSKKVDDLYKNSLNI